MSDRVLSGDLTARLPGGGAVVAQLSRAKAKRLDVALTTYRLLVLAVQKQADALGLPFCPSRLGRCLPRPPLGDRCAECGQDLAALLRVPAPRKGRRK